MAKQPAFTPHNDEQTTNSDQLFLFDDATEINALIDDLMQEPNESLLIGNNQTNISGINLEENNGNANILVTNSVFGNPIRVPVWPVSPSPYTCSCCQTLREFLHINGTCVQKLVIHGRLGIISHAVLERHNDSSSEDREYHMFDFCQESISSVKQFLVQYCDDRKREGSIMLPDPLFYFYDALFVGHGGGGTLVTDISSLSQTAKGDDTRMNREGNFNYAAEDGNGVRLAKSHISSQRERLRKMKLKDLAAYFHLTVNEASKDLNMCASAIKSICRKGGLRRWPYRQIKKAESEIERLTELLNSDDADKRVYASMKINEHQQFIAGFYEHSAG